MTFLPVIIANTLIGIIQEVRAKQVLDNLTMLNAPNASVVRNGKTSVVNAEELVLDDMVIFKAGNQVCADAEVSAGEVQVNESLLTGESDEITKKKGTGSCQAASSYPASVMQDLTKWGRIPISPA